MDYIKSVYNIIGILLGITIRYIYYKICVNNSNEIGTKLGKYFYKKVTKMGPIFVKYGQLLATNDLNLNPNFIIEIKKLLEHSEIMSNDNLINVINEYDSELFFNRFKEFNYTPFAAGSIAQVHSAKLDDGSVIILKILKHKIVEDIKTNVKIMKVILKCVDLFTTHEMVRRIKYSIDVMGEQTDFLKEIKIQSIFHDKYKYNKILYVPKIYNEYCSDKIIVMEYIDGKTINNLLSNNLIDKDYCYELAKHITGFYFTSSYHDYLHCDIHISNVMIRESDKKICILDFGMMGNINKIQFMLYYKFLKKIFNKEYDDNLVDIYIDTFLIKSDKLEQILSDPIVGRILKDNIINNTKEYFKWLAPYMTIFFSYMHKIAHDYDTVVKSDMNNIILSTFAYTGAMDNLLGDDKKDINDIIIEIMQKYIVIM